MKKAFFILLNAFCVVSCSLYAQQKLKTVPLTQSQLVGIWQVNTPIVGSGLGAYFQFYKDGRFIYNTSGYDNLNPLCNIFGSYKLLDGNTIGFKVDSSRQLIGAQIGAADGFQGGTFVLDGGKVVTFPQRGTKYESHDVSVHSKGRNIKCIVIDNDKYYKLSNNPDGQNLIN
jgi:hypothetical protein